MSVTPYAPKGAGAQYAFQMMGIEDDFFHKDTDPEKESFRRQTWVKYTPHHTAYIIQQFSNTGLGQAITCQLSKQPSYMSSTFLAGHWKAIVPNAAAGITSCSYVNGRMYHSTLMATISVGNQLIHKTTGLTAYILHDLSDEMDTFGRYAGVFKTRQGLINDSRQDSWKYLHMKGWSFVDSAHPERSWAIGGVAYHPVPCTFTMNSIDKLVVNYSRISTNSGFSALPMELGSGTPVNKDTASMLLMTNCVFSGAKEEELITHGVTECVIREMYTIAQKTIPRSTTQQTVNIELDCKGPVTFVAIILRSAKDLASGNWMRDVNQNGGLFADNCMLKLGNTYLEDGLPADFYIGPKRQDAFRTEDKRHIFVWSFETDANSKQMTGHLNTTNMDKVMYTASIPPHDDDIVLDGIMSVYNGWYTFNGTCSTVWDTQHA